MGVEAGSRSDRVGSSIYINEYTIIKLILDIIIYLYFLLCLSSIQVVNKYITHKYKIKKGLYQINDKK